jgi:hypothetical protein
MCSWQCPSPQFLTEYDAGRYGPSSWTVSALYCFFDIEVNRPSRVHVVAVIGHNKRSMVDFLLFICDKSQAKERPKATVNPV